MEYSCLRVSNNVTDVRVSFNNLISIRVNRKKEKINHLKMPPCISISVIIVC